MLHICLMSDEKERRVKRGRWFSRVSVVHGLGC